MSSIKGNVTKLLYESSTGYKVGLFKVKECEGEDVRPYPNKTITFTGNFMPLNTEMNYMFVGKIVNHPRFGVQFQVESYESSLPSDIDGIVMYLSSGIFKGIGPKTAKAIVDTFKDETINEIKNGNPYLSRIKGMNEKKAKELTKKILEFDKDQEIIIEFNKLGFTTEECLKIVNKYKSRCFDILENNIYLLSEDINFLKLDKVFLKLHEEVDNVRIDALIKYCIKNICYQRGDTLVSRESLYLEMSKFFSEQLDSKLFLSHVNDMIDSEDIAIVGEYITTNEFYETEANIASTINFLSKISDGYKIESINKRIDDYEKKNNIVFNEIQKEAIRGSLINNVFIITGGPGTGKTTIIKAVVDIYEELNPDIEAKDITLLAPTGRAAKRMAESVKRKASTIHKFLKWNKESKEFSVNRYNPVDTKLVIIDEASMVDIFLFNSLLDGLGARVKIILVGDSGQLPSISPGNVLADLLDVNIPGRYLNEIYRTKKGSYIIPFAKDIRERKEFLEIDNDYEDFKFITSPDILIKKYVQQIVSQVKDKDISIEDFQVLVPMYKGENGIDNINILMQSVFNPESPNKNEIIIRDTIYREGDKVIQLVNDVDNNIYNGDIGYIKRIINAKEALIEIDYSGNKVLYKRGKFDEFTHSYAISVHKSQGSEYDHVLVLIPSNMKRMLYNKLIYTAVTRAKKSLILIGTLESLNYAIQTEYSVNRITSLKTFFLV